MRKARQEYKGLSIEEKDILKHQKKNNQIKKIKKEKLEYIEFPYIDEVDKKQLEGNHIFIVV
jgi:hypothetical protein